MPIRSKLLILFLTIATAPMVLVGALSFSNARDALERTRMAALESIADLKVARIETFFDGLRGDIGTAQGYYNIKTNLPVVARFAQERTSPEYIAAVRMLDNQMKKLQEIKGFFDFMLAGPDGKVVYCTNERHKAREMDRPLPSPGGEGFEEGRRGIYFTGIFRDPVEDDKFGMLVTAPAHDFNGRFIGVIVFEVDMSPIYQLIQDTTGLGETGETLIGKRKGEEVLFLSPLRHDPEAALKRSVALGDRKAVPIQRAARKERWSGVAMDYRGERVLAAGRYIPSLDWGMVAKIDVKEAFASVSALRRLAVTLGVVMLVLVGIAALATARLISEPIQDLTKAAEIIGQGDLGYKTGVKTNDEVGRLAGAFDAMTQHLRAAHEQLRESEQRHRMTIETSHEAFIRMDGKGLISDWNSEAEKIFGWKREEAVGRRLCEVIIPERMRGAHEKGLARFLAAGESAVLNKRREVTALHREGREFPAELTVWPVGKGPAVEFNSFVHDISERKRVEEMIAAKNKELETLLYVVSHDLKEPLRAIEGFSQRISEQYAQRLDETGQDFLRRVVNGAARMRRLLDDFLTLSRSKRIQASREEIAGGLIAQEVLERLRAEIEKTGARVTVAKALPRLRADRTWATQAVYNLVTNALKFTRPGAPPEVEIAAYEPQPGEPSGAGFVVRDRGPGVAPEQRERIFELFQRAVGREVEGTGAGLAIVRSVAEQHGGRAWVRPREGGGSEFVIAFGTARR